MPSNVNIDLSPQGSEEWQKARLGIPTASRAGDTMLRQKNGQPYATRKNYITELVLERLTGEIPEFVESADMKEGKDRERVASLAYQFETGYETEQTGFWYTESYGASPDDLIIGEDGGVEYKNPKASTHYDTLVRGTIPEYYYWQMIQNLLTTGKAFWDYVSYHPGFPQQAQLYIKRVTAKEAKEDIQRLADELEAVNREVNEQITFILNYKKGK